MNKRLLFILIAIVLVAVAGVLVWLKPSARLTLDAAAQSGISHDSPLSAVTATPATLTMSPADIQKRVQEGAKRRQFVRLDDAKLAQAAAQTEMFQSADAAQVAARNPIKLSDAQQHDGRAFISYDPYTLESKGVGDRIQFSIPGVGINRSAIVDQIDVDPDDDIIAWSGHLEDGDQNNESFHISQTIKDNFAIGTITTVDGGMHVIKVKNGVGWVSLPGSETDFGHDDAVPTAAP